MGCLTLHIGGSIHLLERYDTLTDAILEAKDMQYGVVIFIYDCIGVVASINHDDNVHYYRIPCSRQHEENYEE